ncbi:hypothetical protein Tco_0860884 [Tanacetum coccineum]|uniref:Tf2-1-like SH3-like domain-containing protein n=1 Tax=Tanacetum coccineum TaxID=301880 RepID=A0ABQ5BJB4_9ASTR
MANDDSKLQKSRHGAQSITTILKYSRKLTFKLAAQSLKIIVYYKCKSSNDWKKDKCIKALKIPTGYEHVRLKITYGRAKGSYTIQYGVRGMILTAQSEVFKQENVLAEILHGLDQQMERKGDENTAEMLRGHDFGFEYCLASSMRIDKVNSMIQLLLGRYNEGMSPDLWARLEKKLKAMRDRQKSYADNRRKPLEFEVEDRVMLKVSPWKGVICFGKKGKLALRYVGPFEILERIGHVAYRLRFPKELSGVHDTFHVSNLKKCLADASLHVPFDEIKVDKAFRFVEEPIEIMDREVKSLKRSRISLVKVH